MLVEPKRYGITFRGARMHRHRFTVEEMAARFGNRFSAGRRELARTTWLMIYESPEAVRQRGGLTPRPSRRAAR